MIADVWSECGLTGGWRVVQVKALQSSLVQQREVGVHLSSILSNLHDQVGALVSLGHGATPPPAAGAEGAGKEAKGGRGEAPAATRPQVGSNFWATVQEEVEHLAQRWTQVQREGKAALTAQLILPQAAQAMLRKPHELRSPAAVTYGDGEPQQCTGGGKGGEGMALDGERVWQLERGLRDLVASLEKLHEEMQSRGYVSTKKDTFNSHCCI